MAPTTGPGVAKLSEAKINAAIEAKERFRNTKNPVAITSVTTMAVPIPNVNDQLISSQ